MRLKSHLLLLSLLIFSSLVYGQSKEECALAGITLLDMGEYQKAIKELRKARNLDPSDFELTLEIGRAYFLLDKPRKAEEYFNLLLNHSSRTEELFILLSKCSSPATNENPLNQGLVEFPNSGGLYTEMGRVLAAKGKLNHAIAYWEKGIELDPGYPDNYRYASKVYLMNENLIWGWLYGETYLNLLHDQSIDPIFVKEIRNAFRRSISFAALTKPQDQAGRILYQASSTCSIEKRPKKIDELANHLPCLLKEWQTNKGDTFKIPLLDLYERLILQKTLEPYLYWIYGSTNPDELKSWNAANPGLKDQFERWVFWNRLELDSDNKYIKLK